MFYTWTNLRILQDLNVYTIIYFGDFMAIVPWISSKFTGAIYLSPNKHEHLKVFKKIVCMLWPIDAHTYVLPLIATKVNKFVSQETFYEPLNVADKLL